MSPDPRVVVTGYGIRAAVDSLDDAFAAYALGRSRIREQMLPGSSSVRCIAADTPTEPPFEYLTQRKWLKYMGPQTELAVWAAGRALRSAGLLDAGSEPSDLSPMALLLATGPIAFTLDDVHPALVEARSPSGELDFAALGIHGLRACSPMMPFHTLLNMPIGLVSMIFGMKGHNTILYPDAEQSHQVLSQAARGIRRSRFAAALVGGTAQLVSLMPYLTYRRLGWLATTTDSALPFGDGHDGWALSNAAAMVVLESEHHGRARAATNLGYLSIEPNALDLEAAVAKLRTIEADLILLSGSRDHVEDALARRIAGAVACLSLDGVIGYAGAASMPLCVAAACRLLERPELYQRGSWIGRRRVAVLGAFGDRPSSRWGVLHVEAAS